MNTHKRKKERLTEKKYIKRVLSAYFAVNMGMSALFGVTAGIQYAKKGTEKVWFGETESFIQREDVKEFFDLTIDKMQKRMYYYALNNE